MIIPKVQNVSKITSYQSAFLDNEFFGKVFREKSLKNSSREKLLYNIFKERRESQSNCDVTFHTTLNKLFMKYNSVIPCSAAMECSFPFEKNVRRKPKQSELSDEHFEILFFL